MTTERMGWKSRDLTTSVALVVGVAAAALLLWEAAVWYFDLPKALLPTPRQCFRAAVTHRSALLWGTFSTGVAAVAGLLAAVVLGSMIAVALACRGRSVLRSFPT